ncbi:MAG TPA: ABC transporter permease [Bryobacteraceae bacterium]
MPFAHDLRSGFRRLRQSPGFSFAAILTLALGIGANASIFSVINAILFRQLPVVRGSELVTLNETIGGGPALPLIAYPNYVDFRDRSSSVLTDVAAIGFLPASVGQKGNSQRIWGNTVSGNYFDLLGVKPLAGRLLQPEDDKVRGGNPVVVLSYTGWQKRFGGDPAIIGSKIQVNGRDYTVLGVTPQGFSGTELFFSPEIFFPLTMTRVLNSGDDSLDRRDHRNTFALGRLKPGVTVAQAEAALNGIALQLAREYPKENGGIKMSLTPPGLAGAFLRSATIAFAAAMFGVSCLVLLVACTNLASLLLARSSDKRRETAIRLALGASRGILVRQLLIENLIVSTLGGIGGALLASWIMSALAAWHPPLDIPIIVNAPVDTRVFLFALLVSAATALLFGLLPAFQSTKTDLIPALKNEPSNKRFRYWHLRDYMVAAQVCLSVLLLFCSVLVVRSLQRSLDAPIGFDPHGLATASFDLQMQGYDEPRGREFERLLLERVRQIPGVESAALVDPIPLTVNFRTSPIFVEGKPIPESAKDTPEAYTYPVSNGYFTTMRTHLISGREFDDRDRQGSKRVAIVNTAFAAKLLESGATTPLGRRFSIAAHGELFEIVGVAETGKYYNLRERPEPAYWTPLKVDYSAKATLVARSQLPPESVVQAIRGVAREMDPTVALFATGSVDDQLAFTFFPPRIAATMLGVFGILALILAATGIYGVMAYSVSRRTREIGIRMAIGATQAEVLTSVARRAATLIGTGLALGLALALVAGQLLERILYGVKPGDPLSLAIVFALMLTIGAAATFLPARRAARIDPMQALRQE